MQESLETGLKTNLPKPDFSTTDSNKFSKKNPMSLLFFLISIIVFFVANVTDPENIRFLAFDYEALPHPHITGALVGMTLLVIFRKHHRTLSEN